LKKIICLLLTLSLVFTGGCVGVSEDTKNDEKIIIATSFYPIYIFTLNIVNGIDAFEVRCMAEQNIGCLHDYTLTSKDVRLLNDADAFVINGAGMESFVEDDYKNVESLFVIDSSKDIELLCSEDENSSDGDSHNGTHQHSHDHSVNSHIWLSVQNAKKQIENIKDGLAEQFPEYRYLFFKNYEAYIERLNELEKIQSEYTSQINGKRVVTFHKAYDYLAEDLGFQIVTCVESDEGGEPSAKKLAELTERIKEDKICALFTEPQYTGSAADILKNETNIKVFVLNPVTSGEADLTAYENIMKENYELILEAVK
jgi:zinc transport system substrate-binding protein